LKELVNHLKVQMLHRCRTIHWALKCSHRTCQGYKTVHSFQTRYRWLKTW